MPCLSASAVIYGSVLRRADHCLVAQFAILFTGSFPGSMHGFVVGVGRWYNRITAYAFGLTDKYPPFSLRYPGRRVLGWMGA